MKALKYIGVLLLTLIFLFLILGLIAPKKVKIERSVEINASPALVQDILRRFSENKNWSPWEEMDPNVKTSLEGEDGKVGSRYLWEGNSQVGKGNQTITKIENGLIENKLVFEKPMSGEAIVVFKIEAIDKGSKITETFDSESRYPMNALNLIMNPEKMMGPTFEHGLSTLKKYAESLKPILYRGYEVKEMDGPGRSYIGIRKTVSFSEVPQFFAESMVKISEALKKANISPDGLPAGLYYIWDEKTSTTDMIAAMPVKGNPTVPGLTNASIPAVKEIFVDHLGDYAKIGDAHFALDDYMKEKGLKFSAPAIEQYMNDPEVVTDTAKWLTKIIYPVIK